MFYKMHCDVSEMNFLIKFVSRAIIVLCFVLMCSPIDVIAQNSQNCTLIGCAGIGRSSGIGVNGNLACFGDDLFCLRILDVSDPGNPNVLTSIAVPSSVEDVVISGLYAYVAMGNSGLSIIDISNPAAP